MSEVVSSEVLISSTIPNIIFKDNYSQLKHALEIAHKCSSRGTAQFMGNYGFVGYSNFLYKFPKVKMETCKNNAPTSCELK